MSLFLSQHFPLATRFSLLQYPRIGDHPFGAGWKPFLRSLSLSSRVPVISAQSTSNEELLQALVGFDGGEDESRSHLPAVRTYENDLSRFTLIGAVDFDQALTAAAADGGDAADEHLSSGLNTMVIETVYPGSNSHSTVSTRLFLPSREVKEKAKEIRATLADDIFSGNTSKNILAMTFRQVILHRVLSFELEFFSPGSQRDMEDLSSPREISSEKSISSENLSVVAALAEAICSCVLECTKRTYLKNNGGKASTLLSNWFQNPQIISSSDSTIRIYVIPPNHIPENSPKREYKKDDVGLCDWSNEYRLQINGKNLKDVKFNGWKKLPDDRWEILLTHLQMVELADILDMYYEDRYTLPSKQFLSGLIGPVSIGSKNEIRFSWKLASVILLGILLLASLRIRARIHPQHLFESRITSESLTDSLQPMTLDYNESKDLCLSVVQRIQEALGRSGDVSLDRNIGAWVGELPTFLERESSSSHKNSEEETTSSQDIASYQVVLSREGKVVGFQPTSRTAVPHWASNPLAVALHEGKKLSPGILEPTAKVPRPQEVVLVEVLMSVNPDSWFILARPIQ